MTAKEKLLERVTGLSEREAGAALAALERELEDPLLRALANAPEDDEPFTADDETAVAEADADLTAGRTVSLEDIERRYPDA